MASFINKLSPIPSFPQFTGPYEVGTKDVEIAAVELQDASSTFTPVSTIQFRCFYPCEPPSKPSKPVYWVQGPQRSTISAYCRFSGFGSNISTIFSYFPQVFYHIQIPALRNAPLLPPRTHSKRWPVLIFSHGLGGSRNSYSQICGTLASYGIVVVAPEHRDGSCAVSYVRATKTTDAYAVDYKKFSHKPSSEVYNGRDEMLRIRLWEMALIHEALRKIDGGHDLQNLDLKTTANTKLSSTDCLTTFRDKLSIHNPGSIIYAGHSFGSATSVQYLKSLYYHPNNQHYTATRSALKAKPSDLLCFHPSPHILNQITPSTATILLDLWTLPLNSPTQYINQLPMPCFFNSPEHAPRTSPTTQASSVLAVLSSAFVNWTDNFEDVKRVLADLNEATHKVNPALIFYPTSSAHLSQSDFGIIFPRLTKYFAKAEEPERTLKLNSRAMLQMLRGRGFEVAGADDSKILSLKEGAVRGWVAVAADSVCYEDRHPQSNDVPSLKPSISDTQGTGGGELAEATVDGMVSSKH